jgi:anti-sigma factor (TIGR02949 family)
MNDENKKLECEEAIKMILEYLDKELPDHDHEAMDAHLEKCRSCYSRMEFEKILKTKVSSLPVLKAPDSLRNKIKKVTGKY